jgi:hypothetical protein
MALAPAHFVHADLEEAIEAVRIEAVTDHPFDDAADRVPVNAQQPADRRLVHGGGEPSHQILEVRGEGGSRSPEGYPFDSNAMVRTGEPAQLGADLQTPAAEVEVPPDRRRWPGVVASPGRERAERAIETPSAQGHRDGDGVRAEGDAGDPDAIEAHKVLECGGDAHGLRSPTRMQ